MEVRKWMLALAVAFCSISAASSKSSTDAETPRITDMINIQQRLYIKWRNYNWTTNRCHSATKNSGSGGHYEITLRVRPPRWEHLYLYKTNLTTLATRGHQEHNAAIYRLGPGYPPVVRELIYSDPDAGCFILKESLSGNKTGCQLLQTENTIDNGVPSG
uniref:Putative secreted protein n=1 Tax=Amblyomma cajennense TaxID=34607 RepID=A0A023FCW3_AMBCJ